MPASNLFYLSSAWLRRDNGDGSHKDVLLVFANSIFLVFDCGPISADLGGCLTLKSYHESDSKRFPSPSWLEGE